MSSIYAITAKLQLQNRTQLDAKQNRGTNALERLNQTKKQNNRASELLASKQERLSDQLKDAAKEEGEHWFKTGLKNWVGIESDTERLSNEKSALTIEQQFDQRQHKQLQAETGALTSDLKSVISESKANASEVRKARSKEEQLKQGRRSDQPLDTKTGFQGMKRMLRVHGEASQVQRESGQIALQERERGLSTQKKNSLQMKSEALHGLEDKMDGEDTARFIQKLTVVSDAISFSHGVEIFTNYLGSNTAISSGLDRQAEHTQTSQHLGLVSENAKRTVSSSEEKLSQDHELQATKNTLDKIDQLI